MTDDPQPGEVPETEIELFLTILNNERDENNKIYGNVRSAVISVA